jgi:hypothetical protein
MNPKYHSKCLDCTNGTRAVLRRKDQVTHRIRTREILICSVYATKMNLEASYIRCQGKFYSKKLSLVRGGK